MKSFIFTALLAAIVSTSAFADVQKQNCIANVYKDSISKRVHLSYNEQTKRLEGYRANTDIGGILFTVSESGIYTTLSIFTGSGESYPLAASKEVTSVEERRLETTIDGYELTLLCY